MKSDLPKVLVISTNAWKDNTGINTLINFFKNWNSDKLAQVYTKSSLPKTKVCNRFFQIPENEVIKSVYSRKMVKGKVINSDYTPNPDDLQNEQEEQKRYSKARKKHSWIMTIAREIVWLLGKWKSPQLETFLKEYNPDVLFVAIYPTIYMGLIQLYILKKTKKCAVCYLADDNYTYKTCVINPLAYVHRFFLRKVVKRVVAKCNKMFVIAPKQKEEYDRIFNVDSIILTKGIDFSDCDYENKAVAFPIKMVYTGKLIIGRGGALAAIAEALADINRDGEKFILDIYTTDTVTKKMDSKLNRNCCRVRGAVPLNEVIEIQKQADILIFVESLEWKYKNMARLSFSTKITDYLKSGKCILAIGDKEIAPIDYFLRNDSAIVATSYQQITEKLKMILAQPEMIELYRERAFNCGLKNHNRQDIDRILLQNIEEVVEYGKNNS